MDATQTTTRLLNAYAEDEPWEESQACFKLEETLAWGIQLLHGLLDLEARIQAQAMKRPGESLAIASERMPQFYLRWAEISEHYLRLARTLQARGHEIDGLDAFLEAVEEVRCLLGNLALEGEIRPLEELLERARPENPLPGRYRD